LIHNDILLVLDLSDNLIGYEGSRYLAQAMKKNQNLHTLRLKLNNFNDKAGMKFFKDLMPNKILQELDFAANTLSVEV
jgi:Ran GTPase-activating protein (RanGAP) involved in mRNA processing and transport